jgi:hypothetical protein
MEEIQAKRIPWEFLETRCGICMRSIRRIQIPQHFLCVLSELLFKFFFIRSRIEGTGFLSFLKLVVRS